MIVLGLTGSIGMGKSTAAAVFEAEGVPVHSADASVHRLYAGRAAPLVEAAFPGTVRGGVVDREALARVVLADPEARRRLEGIVHPLVREEEAAFLRAARESGAALAVLDIPLLFENGGESRVDRVLVVSASEAAQEKRVLARPGMTPERLAAIRAAQVPDAEKRRRADVVIRTDGPLEDTRAALRDLVARLRGEASAPSGR